MRVCVCVFVRGDPFDVIIRIYKHSPRGIYITTYNLRTYVPIAKLFLLFYSSGGQKMFVVAGGQSSSSADILNLETMEWRAGPNLPSKYDTRGGFLNNTYTKCEREIDFLLLFLVALRSSASVAYKSTFLLVGGLTSSNYDDTIFEFDPETDEWIQRNEMLSEGKDRLMAIMVQDDIVNCA